MGTSISIKKSPNHEYYNIIGKKYIFEFPIMSRPVLLYGTRHNAKFPIVSRPVQKHRW